MPRGFDPTKTNIPGTNLPYSVPNKGTLPEWDKQLPTALQGKGDLIPIFTGSNTGSTPTVFGGSMRWFDPLSGKTYSNNGTTADNQFTGFSNMGNGTALLQQRAAANGGVLTTRDYQDALNLMRQQQGATSQPVSTPVNYRNYNNPTQMNNSYVPQGKQQYEMGVHQFGDGNYYYTPDVKEGGGFAGGGSQPIKIPSQFIDPRAAQGGQKLTAEGKKWLQEQKRFGPRASSPTPQSSSPSPQSFSPTPNTPTSFGNISPNTPTSPTNTLPRTSLPQSFGTPPSWAMGLNTSSSPTTSPNTNTSATSNSLFPPPNITPPVPSNVGSLLGGGNYGGSSTPVSTYNSPLFQGNNKWQEYIRQWLQGNNVQQNS